jgi:hypothetical protein
VREEIGRGMKTAFGEFVPRGGEMYRSDRGEDSLIQKELLHRFPMSYVNVVFVTTAFSSYSCLGCLGRRLVGQGP